MRLKKLEISGFKSFPEKSKIIFPPGISAVVGPNGCGKSNIVDALRWVMGEQSIKQLRGKNKEDIIFSGAAGKQKVNLAEVSLLVENNLESATAPLNHYAEIMITRRLYRSGESLYMINRQPCRLRDIHDIFLGSGTGKNSFAVIQQGNIGAITDASPEERRYFIEEAADITKYKTRKKETLSKIKTVRENLVRITDITNEIKRQINALDRQAKKAVRFKEFRKRARYLDIKIAVWKFEGITFEIDALSRSIGALKNEYTKETTESATLEAELASLKGALANSQHRIEDLKNKHHETQRIVDKYENDISHYRKSRELLKKEIAENKNNCARLATRNNELEHEIEQVENNFRSVTEKIAEEESVFRNDSGEYESIKASVKIAEEKVNALHSRHMTLAGDSAKYNNMLSGAQKREEDITRRIKLVDEEVYLLQQRFEGLKKEKTYILEQKKENDVFFEDAEADLADAVRILGEKQAALSAHSEVIKEIQLEQSRVVSEYRTLSKMDRQHEWYKDGVKEILESPFNYTPRVLSVLADVISPDPGYEKAVEAALGDLLQSVVVDTIKTGVEIACFLSAAEGGRCTFVPVAEGETEEPVENEAFLINHVSCAAGFEKTVRALLGDILVAETFDKCVEIHKENSGRHTVVTPKGEMITKKMFVTAGENRAQVSILGKKNELRALQADISANEEKLAHVEGFKATFENEIEDCIRIKEEAGEELEEIREEGLEIEKKRYTLESEINGSEHRLNILLLEQEQLEGEKEDIEEELENTEKKVRTISDEIQKTAYDLETVKAEHGDLSNKIEKLNQEIVDAKLKITSLKAQKDNYRNSIDRLNSFLNEGRERYRHYTEDIDNKLTTVRQTDLLLKKSGEDVTGLSGDLAIRLVEIEKEEGLCGELKENKFQKEKQIEKHQKTHAEKLDRIQENQIRLKEVQMQREHLTNRIEEKYHHRINQYQLEFEENEPAGEPLTEFDITVLETELKDLQLKIKKMGDVNLGAISEFEELKTRYDFMQKQHDDLTASLDDLEKIIDKINSVSQERFIKTFNAINEKLSEVFLRLFEGGTAQLVLTDPSSPLETGVELMIKPPGKTLTRLSLLSGGEKALSAIAFVFAVFLIKPASFCIMDEIDAPLDDSNVVRFNNLIKLIGEQSQILIITHNKLTMEFADILFGVTMENKGVSKIVSVNLTKNGVVETESVEVA